VRNTLPEQPVGSQPAPDAVVVGLENLVKRPPRIDVRSSLDMRTIAVTVRLAGERYGLVSVAAQPCKGGATLYLQWKK
jgi:hypothetical protein